MLKRFISAVFVLLLVCGVFVNSAAPASAYPTVTPQPPAATAPSTLPIIITALQTNGSVPDFVQIYNNSDTIMQLDGWTIQLSIAEQSTPLTLIDLEHWIKPRSYAVFSYEGAVSGADGYYSVTGAVHGTALSIVSSQGGGNAHTVQLAGLSSDSSVWYARSVPSSGKYTDSNKFGVGTADLYGKGLYAPPSGAAGLEIVEILPNARSCAPSENALDCSDYVKIYNARSSSVDLSQYRLRSDSNGLKSSSTNTFTLSGVLSPLSYVTVTTRDTGEPLSLTNTGGFVWIEDAYGVIQYELSEKSYEDASAVSKKGLSWAFDGRDGTWKWMMPAPNAPNYWSPEMGGRGADEADGGSNLANCGSGRERNPETNRCRAITTTVSSALTPCKQGQERNPETNRCRSVLSASTSLQPCAADQYRNPETNRCKKKEASDSLVPCKEGQERNPETNRCRKITLAANEIPSVKDIKSESKANTTGWWIAGAAVLAALAYGIYEWRQDILQRLRRLKK